MNIYATKGHKVIAKNLDWGYPEDIRKAAKYLTPGGVYTVSYTDVGGWRTDVKLAEFDGVLFNSVHFEDFKEGVE